jgi:hypothetical protein
MSPAFLVIISEIGEKFTWLVRRGWGFQRAWDILHFDGRDSRRST